MKKSLGKIYLNLLSLILLFSVESVFALNTNVPPPTDVEDFNPEDYYKPDTDGDGIIDIYDKDPYIYNITDRDLRFFMKLTYRSEEEIEKIFAGNEAEINKFNKEQLFDAADIREMIKNWRFVRQVNKSNGFSASIFSVGNQAVLAIRGTDGSNDLDDDAAIGFKTTPKQAYSALEMEQYLKDYSAYYLTGHSLGGYLAQYLIGKSLYLDSNFKHAALFNAPGVALTFDKKTEKISEAVSGNPYFSDADKRYPFEEKKSQAFSISGDPVSKINQIPNILWNNQVNTDMSSKHKSSNYFGTKPDENFRKWFSTGYRLDKPYLDLDTDNDGIKDVDELRIGTDYTLADTDGDGFDDKEELIFGSDPINPKKSPRTCAKPPYIGGVQLPTKLIISTANPNGEDLTNSKNGFIKMESVDKPFVITRLSTRERSRIKNPAEGMLIWNTTKQCLELYKDFGYGLEWDCITQGCNE